MIKKIILNLELSMDGAGKSPNIHQKYPYYDPTTDTTAFNRSHAKEPQIKQ